MIEGNNRYIFWEEYETYKNGQFLKVKAGDSRE
jgi:hypothetical protein